MFALLLLICACLFGSLPGTDSSNMNDVSKCDKKIVEKIEELQCLWGRPGCLIENAAKYGVEYVVSASDGYFTENTTCVWSKAIPNEDFTIANVSVYHMNTDNSTSQDNITETEKCGSTYNLDAKIVAIHIWVKNGVTVVYLCDTHENAKTGPPTFFMKCSSERCDAKDLKDGENVLNRMGCGALKNYPACKECVFNVGIH